MLYLSDMCSTHIAALSFLMFNPFAIYVMTGAKKGRRFGTVWKCNIFLLGQHNDDIIPPSLEQSRLTRNGLGRTIRTLHYLLVVMVVSGVLQSIGPRSNKPSPITY